MNKIVHLVSPYLFNTGSWIYSQIQNLEEFESHIFTTFTENLEQYPHPNIVAAWEFNEPKKFISRFMLRYFNRQGIFFGPVHNKIKPLIYQAHMGFEGVRWLDFVKSTGTPLVTTFYGQDVSKLGRIPFWQKKYKELFKYGSLFLAEGNNLRNELIKLGCPPEKAVVQHLGVNLINYVPVKKEYKESRKFIILQVASYKPKKGYYSALLTIKELLKTHKNFEFRIIGSGTKKEVAEMVAWVSELELAQHVKLLGALPHTKYREELASADIFFHPSVVAPDGDTEGGSPVGITEASAIGIPVVATSHADIPEVVIDGVTGRLAPEKDIVGLAAHLAWFMDNMGKMAEFGEAGRKRIEKEYNIHIQIKRLEKLYNDVLNGSRTGL